MKFGKNDDDNNMTVEMAKIQDFMQDYKTLVKRNRFTLFIICYKLASKKNSLYHPITHTLPIHTHHAHIHH